jgi:hypothetical protein
MVLSPLTFRAVLCFRPAHWYQPSDGRLCREGSPMSTDTRHHVHVLVDQLPAVQLAAVETLLRSMLDPVSRKLALAPVDDEPFTEEDRQAVAEADEWRKHNALIPLENVLSDFGLTMADWEAMGKTPLPEENGTRNG